jgi:hypothetical protein
MISTRSVGLVIDTVVCLTLDKWETVSGQFGGYLIAAYNKRQARKKQARYSADMRKKNRGLAAAIARMQVDNK